MRISDRSSDVCSSDLRLQFSLQTLLTDPKRHRKDCGNLTLFLKRVEGFLIRGFPSCRPSDWSAIESLPKCDAQLAHTDFTTDVLARAQKTEEMAFAALLSVADGARLRIWRSGDAAAQHHDVALDAGDQIGRAHDG